MNELAIDSKDLAKTYGSIRAVGGINLTPEAAYRSLQRGFWPAMGESLHPSSRTASAMLKGVL
jgi:hypothetical protein